MNANTPAPVPTAAVPRRLRAGAVKRCPSCRTPLDGGPVRFRCEACARSVMAADLDTEYHPTADRPADRCAEPLGANPVRTAPEGRHPR